MITAMVQIRFSEQTQYGEYNDCLYYTVEEYANITQEQINSEIQSRLAKWIDVVQTPPIPLNEEAILEQRLETFKVAIAADEPVINSILDAAIQIVPNISNRNELRSALLSLGGD